MKKKLRLILPLIILLGNSCSNKTEKLKAGDLASSEDKTITKVFEKISNEQSGINFSNTLKENVGSLDNLFNFDYFYNGAGVGVEDLNNDGLLDIFFCGNQVENKLFLNKGDLQFEDISKSAGINKGKHWSNGITFVDINNDGYKDIYVSQGGPNPRDKRKNLLYINNHDLTFSEKAQEYGLADQGITTQSTFFDFDNDGDLDCIVMNENELYGVDPINLYKMVDQNSESKYFNSSHLYRNDHGKFKDITKAAGLERPIFGLGLCVSDINQDGWLDIYIASDYYIPDALFINNQNATFSDQIKKYTQHSSYFGMGIDIADINNDNLQDIFVLDMSSNDHFRAKTLMASMNTSRFNYLVNEADFHYQYMFNSLQLNIGNNQFNDIAQLTNTANTDWSWSVLMTDFDNDEDADIFISNGYRKYALDNDLQLKVFEAKKKYRNNVPLALKQELYNQMPSEKLENVLFQNNGSLQFEENAKAWGLNDFSFSNGVAQGDLDNDGDLDLIINNIDENAFLYKNLTSDNTPNGYLKVKTSGKTSEPFARVEISYNGKTQQLEQKRTRGYMSAQSDDMLFGLGTTESIDTVSIHWLNGKTEQKFNIKANTTLVFDVENSKIKPPSENRKMLFEEVDANAIGLDFKHVENTYDDFETEILLPYKQSTNGPLISKGDANGDGAIDIYIGGASGQAGQLFLQNNTGFVKSNSKIFEEDSGYEDMQSVFFDFDNDNDLDLYVVSGGTEFEENSSFYADRIYINNGKGKFSKSNINVLKSFPKSGKAVSIIDFDKDGDHDIIVGNRNIPKKYPIHSASILYENIGGDLKNVTETIAQDLMSYGIVNDLTVSDVDNDGWDDIVVVGEWSDLGFLKNTNGKFKLQSNITEENTKGWWLSITETDINNDGLKDYLIGNIGLNYKLHASVEKPLRIFAEDFDQNGSTDIVLSKDYKGMSVPVRGRECSSQQMPFIKDKFKSYTEFANASLADIYGDTKLKESYKKEITELRSIILINKGNFKFEKVILPALAQQFPILQSTFFDIDDDGFEDCILAGSIYNTEVETTRLDAISGLVLKTNGTGTFEALPYPVTGLYLKGDVKDILHLKIKKDDYLITSTNNNRLKAYKTRSNNLSLTNFKN